MHLTIHVSATMGYLKGLTQNYANVSSANETQFEGIFALQSQQAISADASALVNEAFSTLKSPLKRGEYLVSSSSQ